MNVADTVEIMKMSSNNVSKETFFPPFLKNAANYTLLLMLQASDILTCGVPAAGKETLRRRNYICLL